ncbi:hypothetical protein CKM354_001288800 [Cercospora kikuchii]|uniref:Cyclopentanone 1,2-monooxygenase n=1 Tax=Cercospora kikuchii TaxID=84275 RepID=A0A9P3L272_9PEZI|nr:uncharacterized protein CKM354_001288800 [Cercospora kikuchii]GIZ49870.1 hypothetical protein CKM354_001288800 [Cercospora kikuchii]
MALKVIELDALIVGAGFGGVYQLKRLKDEGFNLKLVESGSDYGGVWYWNRYPGARVDSTIPHYEFSDADLYTGWMWSQRFPGSEELRKYFRYVAEKWKLVNDTQFSTLVTGAVWDETSSRWMISTNAGVTYKYLQGKKIAVIGTGSTGIRLCQDLAPLASEFVLFQRTPNLALPMKQVQYDTHSTQAIPREQYDELYKGRSSSYGGFNFNFLAKNTFDDSEEERLKTYEDLWSHGDFHYWLATYQDMLFVDSANTEAYNFWRDKVRARLPNERLKEKFAPMQKPHAFGCKRISLENGFYELFSQEHVHLVDVNETPIEEVTPQGIKTSEKVWEFDYVVCATGFDAITGGMLFMNVEGRKYLRLQDKWADGVKTFMGLCVGDFPNMLFTYGPQAPTALCNGPSCAELQGECIVSLLKQMRQEGKQTVNASSVKEEEWAASVRAIANMSLLPGTKSWYMGDNIPGKKRECLIYLGGVPTYYKTITECAAKGYEGFEFA